MQWKERGIILSSVSIFYVARAYTLLQVIIVIGRLTDASAEILLLVLSAVNLSVDIFATGICKSLPELEANKSVYGQNCVANSIKTTSIATLIAYIAISCFTVLNTNANVSILVFIFCLPIAALQPFYAASLTLVQARGVPFYAKKYLFASYIGSLWAQYTGYGINLYYGIVATTLSSFLLVYLQFKLIDKDPQSLITVLRPKNTLSNLSNFLAKVLNHLSPNSSTKFFSKPSVKISNIAELLASQRRHPIASRLTAYSLSAVIVATQLYIYKLNLFNQNPNYITLIRMYEMLSVLLLSLPAALQPWLVSHISMRTNAHYGEFTAQKFYLLLKNYRILFIFFVAVLVIYLLTNYISLEAFDYLSSIGKLTIAEGGSPQSFSLYVTAAFLGVIVSTVFLASGQPYVSLSINIAWAFSFLLMTKFLTVDISNYYISYAVSQIFAIVSIAIFIVLVYKKKAVRV